MVLPFTDLPHDNLRVNLTTIHTQEFRQCLVVVLHMVFSLVQRISQTIAFASSAQSVVKRFMESLTKLPGMVGVLASIPGIFAPRNAGTRTIC